jgi:methionyl-tRNA formyltransferase
MPSRLKVVLMTNGGIGLEVAAHLAELDEVEALTVVTTNVTNQRRRKLEKARIIFRHEGPRGLARALGDRWHRRVSPERLAERFRARCPGATLFHCPDLHAPESLARLRALGADLGVVVAAYKLEPSVFTIPRLGCLNLHFGRAPEFRGSSPGFYELLEGVPEVGVTVHRVSATLDGGAILAQETFPLDIAPPEDPVAYLLWYQRAILVPNGARMLASVVAGLAHGPLPERTQDESRARTRRRATWRLKRELRQVVRARRRPAEAAPTWLTSRPTAP